MRKLLLAPIACAMAVCLDDEGLLRLDLADGSHQRFERAE